LAWPMLEIAAIKKLLFSRKSAPIDILIKRAPYL
jgi:hypothetical protein